MYDRWTRRLEWTILGAAGITVALGVALPIYVDEVNWQMLRGRILLDAGQTIRFNYPSCGLPFAAATPWYFLPFRLIHAAIYAGLDSPLYLRLAAIGTTLSVFALLLLLLSRLPDAPPLRHSAALLAGIATLGVLPLLLMLDRPEPLLLATGAVLFLMPVRRAPPHAITAALIMLSALAMLSLHPKALFFLPLMLCAAWLVAPGRIARIALPILLLLAAGAAYADWSARMACPDDAHVRGILEAHSVPIALLADPVGFLTQVLRNQVGTYHALSYFTAILFRDRYMSDWLPPGTRPALLGSAANILVVLAFACLALALAGALASRLAACLRQRRLDRTTALILALLASLLAVHVFQAIKNDYEASLILPFFALAALVALRQGAICLDIPGAAALTRLAVPTLLLVSLVSQITLWTSFLPQAFGPWSQGGYLPTQQHSVASLNNAPLLATARATARRCAIPPDTTARHLVIDPLTYMAFSRSREPFLLSYVSGGWGQGIADLPDFLSRRGASGVIVRCRNLPASLRTDATERDGFCCLGRFGK